MLLWSLGPLYVCQEANGDQAVESTVTGCVQTCDEHHEPVDGDTCLDGSDCSDATLALVSTLFKAQPDIPTDTVGVPLPASEGLNRSLPPQQASYGDYLLTQHDPSNHERALSLRSVILLV